MEENTQTNSTVDNGVYTETLTQQYNVASDEALGTNYTPEDTNETNQNNTDVRTTNETQDTTGNQEASTQNVPDIQERVAKHEKTLEAVRKDLRTKGVDLNQAVKEYSTYGALSKQTMADLAQAGYPKEVVEGFLATQQVLENNFTQEVFKAAGGEKEYTNLVQWAGANMSPASVSAFNKAIDSNNLEAIKLMLDGMRARRNAVMGTRNPSLLGGASTGRSTNNKGFANKQEMIQAMSDPRYNTDRAYNQAVVNKLLNSHNIF